MPSQLTCLAMHHWAEAYTYIRYIHMLSTERDTCRLAAHFGFRPCGSYQLRWLRTACEHFANIPPSAYRSSNICLSINCLWPSCYQPNVTPWNAGVDFYVNMELLLLLLRAFMPPGTSLREIVQQRGDLRSWSRREWGRRWERKRGSVACSFKALNHVCG